MKNGKYINMGAYIKYLGGGRRVLQVFQKKCCSPGDHRPKYFMAQSFFWEIFHGPYDIFLWLIKDFLAAVFQGSTHNNIQISNH